MEIVAVIFAVVLGALVKSVTGIGLPPIAIPVLAVLVGPRDAVVVMTLSTIVTNAYLTWTYRDAARETQNLPTMIAAGVVGAPLGVYFLTSLDPRVVGAVLGVIVVIYVVMSLSGKQFTIDDQRARRLAAPVGFLGGAVQGATGLSAVVLASYIHALGISQRAFIFSVSALFQVFALVQGIGFIATGAYTAELVAGSVVAAVVAMTTLAVGTRFTVRMSPTAFNRVVMAVLTFSALKLLYDAAAR